MKLLFLFISLSFFVGSFAQGRYIVYFKDKGTSPQLEVLSEKAKQRRKNQNIRTDSRDFKVSVNYLNNLQSLGTIKGVSRWLNAALLETEVDRAQILALPFVSRCDEIHTGPQPKSKPLDHYGTGAKSVDYGIADTQVVIMNLDCMHDMGYTGAGMLIAIIDGGFNGMDTISYFNAVFAESRIVDQYDFVGDGTEVYQYSGHGTSVASCIVGEKGEPNTYAGTAIDATLALYVTEDVGSESLAEEFNLVAALERADLLGVDVANISLGYTTFDNAADNHPYSDMDGVTTIAAQGVNVAGAKGILVVAAAGNEGPSTISTPCDADSALCVGAVSKLGNYAFFSSVGPAADGDIKPNVAAVGRKAWVIMEDGSLDMANGTSFASPITAGGVACLRQANPTADVASLLTALESTASQALNPDQYLGYGIPDFCAAHTAILTAGLQELSSHELILYPVPAKDHLSIRGWNEKDATVQLRIYDNAGSLVYEVYHATGDSIELDISALGAGTYFLELKGEYAQTVRKVVVLPK